MNINNRTLGRHLLLELYNCDTSLLNDTKRIEAALVEAARLVGATIIDTSFHHFSPYGVSGVVIIAESHITVHTWPEYNYAAVDVFTCDESINISTIIKFLKAEFKAESFEQRTIRRGLVMSVKTEFV
ncbi:MAG: adenosylmethionine decarboxylase [Calditrichaceae bacterium]